MAAAASANTKTKMTRNSPHPSASSKANKDDEFMRQFGAVLAQLKVGNIASLALSVRQNLQARDDTEQRDQPRSTGNAVVGCRVSPEPLGGSYNIAYRVLFDDEVEWILRVPANGSHARFDRMAADAMSSEALTMKMIKLSTTIPVPTVYTYDVSSDNEIGCPYILMEFLKGRPLYEGWFNSAVSNSKREQFRARALHTIAAAMVQLNIFTLHRGGALRFDSAGLPVDVAGAKVPDATAFYDAVDKGSYPEHDIWCENGPTSDPSSYLLFTLNRRGYRGEDSAYSKGVDESSELFTQWALELSGQMSHEGQQFVLAHPDFDLQNILVHDDGTLSGILDWDGVAAVPLSVGCLRYPDWLIRDWDPVTYNWDVEAHEPKSYSGRPENTPDELVCYRAMYAQFIETLLSNDPSTSRTGKVEATITRMSVITKSLEVAVNMPQFTGQMVGHLYREMKRVVGEEASTGFPVMETLEPNAESDLDDSDDSDRDVLVSEDEDEGDNSDEETEPTEVREASCTLSDHSKGSDPESLCQKCVANLDQSSLNGVNEKRDGPDISALTATFREAPEFQEDRSSEVLSPDYAPAKDVARDQKPPWSPKDKVAKWVLGLLGLGEKGCKGASEAFHKKDKASNAQAKDWAEATPVHIDCRLGSTKTAICLCNLAETLLKKMTAQIHQDRAPGPEGSNPKNTESKRVHVLLSWLTDIINKMIHKPIDSNVETSEKPIKVVLVDTEHCQRCHSHSEEETSSARTAKSGVESPNIDSADVWASIAAEVNKGGIPIGLIKKHHDVIAQCVIENLGQEIQQEKEKEKKTYLKHKKTARAREARKQTQKKNANQENNPNPIQHAFVASESTKPIASAARVEETEKAQIEMPEGSVDGVMSRKMDAAYRSNAFSLGRVKSNIDKDFKKPISTKSEPENAAGPGSIVVAPKNHVSQAADDKGAATEQPSHTNSELLKRDVFYEVVKSANQKLRAMLSSIQGLEAAEAAEANMPPNTSGIAEDDREDSESETSSEKSSCTTVSATSLENAALRSQIAVKGGRWFETPGGNLNRVKDEDLRGDTGNDQEVTSLPSSCSPEIKGGPSKNSVASHENSKVTKVSDIQLLFPKYSQPEICNVFQVPDFDENVEVDDDEYAVEDFTQSDNSGDRDELEEGEVLDEKISDKISVRPGPKKTVDYGNFTMSEICVALGNGNLDEERMKKLEMGFKKMLAEALGII